MLIDFLYRSTGDLRMWRHDHHGNLWLKVRFVDLIIRLLLKDMVGGKRTMHWSILLLRIHDCYSPLR